MMSIGCPRPDKASEYGLFIGGTMSEWISVEDQLPTVFSGVFNVKKQVKITTCYFFRDKMQWIAFYGEKPCYFWDKHTRLPVSDATHWMPLPEKPNE